MPVISTDSEIRESDTIQRYMDLPKLLDLLHFKALYLRRADGFTDRLEGALFPSLRSSINAAHSAREIPYDADYFYERSRVGNYVSCWTLGEKDSMAHWQLYAGAKTGVAVTSTIKQLVSTALSWNRDSVIHRVKYVDHRRVNKYVIGNYTDVLQFKHEAYTYEKELRLIVPQEADRQSNPMSLRLKVPNLETLVSGVVVAPEADEEFYEAVKELCRRYDLKAPVRRSKLTGVPV
ncbi:MAG: hypothetical protein L6Q69_17635 [Zoogloea sp.]|uniref:DUF2971 domain-containing protein n=1 Tax=Zoogloea oryzae TaxID=310767 RepID=A0ABQ6FF89_9RHOO|nr:hypothetical protein [Zoogloea oryzae]MCK6375900.1 hypothetical protein [Zoogloea sp.]GLT24278.1 DUF2971 domain-containing protein [Zoogloea oryzae]